jgi:hypothetical protein
MCSKYLAVLKKKLCRILVGKRLDKLVLKGSNDGV